MGNRWNLSIYSDRPVVPHVDRCSCWLSHLETTAFSFEPARRTPSLFMALLPFSFDRLGGATMPRSPLYRITVPVPPLPACLERIRFRLTSKNRLLTIPNLALQAPFPAVTAARESLSSPPLTSFSSFPPKESDPSSNFPSQ